MRFFFFFMILHSFSLKASSPGMRPPEKVFCINKLQCEEAKKLAEFSDRAIEVAKHIAPYRGEFHLPTTQSQIMYAVAKVKNYIWSIQSTREIDCINVEPGVKYSKEEDSDTYTIKMLATFHQTIDKSFLGPDSVKKKWNNPANTLVYRHSSSNETIDSYLENIRKELSVKEKVQFLSDIGGALQRNYDENKNDTSKEASRGIVNLQGLLNSASRGKKAGICVDIATGMAQIAEKIGMGKSFILGYPSAGNGHAIMITSHPDNSNKVYTFNYYETYGSSGESGAAVLNQKSKIPDLGTKHQIYNSDGKSLADLPSEYGLVLNDIYGNKEHIRAPLAKSNSKIVSIDVKKGLLNGKVFMGNLASGEKIIGISKTAKWLKDSDNFSGQLGVSIDQRKGNRGKVDIDVTGLNYMLQQNLNSNYLQMGKSNYRLESSLYYEQLASKASVISSDSKKSIASGTVLDRSYGLKLGSRMTKEWRSADNKKKKINISLSTFLKRAQKDVRGERTDIVNANEGDTPIKGDHSNSNSYTILQNYTIIHGNYSQVKSSAPDVETFLDFIINNRYELGTQGRLSIGSKNTQTGDELSAGVEGSFSSDTPSFVPGARRNSFVKVAKRINPDWKMSVELKSYRGKSKDEKDNLMNFTLEGQWK